MAGANAAIIQEVTRYGTAVNIRCFRIAVTTWSGTTPAVETVTSANFR